MNMKKIVVILLLHAVHSLSCLAMYEFLSLKKEDETAVINACHKLLVALNNNSAEDLTALLPLFSTNYYSKEDYAKLFLDQLRLWRERAEDERSEWAILITQGLPDSVDPVRMKSSSNMVCRVWMSSPKKNMRGWVEFMQQDNEWKWIPPVDPNASLPCYRYDLSTPTKSFLTLGHAMFSGFKTDLAGVFEALSIVTGKDKIPYDTYRRAIEKRRNTYRVKHGDFSFSQDCLAEEIAPAEHGRPSCRVWRIDAKGQRISYELFIKEGNMWKWLPGLNSIWHPSESTSK